MKIALRFGGLAEPIKDQLAAQSLRMPEDCAIRAQRFADSILLLSIHAILSDGEKDRARKRLVKYIAKHAEAAE